jgi:hypothetical protein
MPHPALAGPLPIVVKRVTIDAAASHHNVSNFEKVFAEVAALEALAGGWLEELRGEGPVAALRTSPQWHS